MSCPVSPYMLGHLPRHVAGYGLFQGACEMARSRSYYMARFGKIVPSASGDPVPEKTEDKSTADKPKDDKSDDKSQKATDDKSKDDKPDKSKDDKAKDDKSKVVTFEKDGVVYVAQSSVDALVADAAANAEKSTKKSLEEAKRKKDLEEQGNYKALWEEEKTRADRLEAENKIAGLSGTRLRIGQKLGLSATVSERLVGNDEKEIEEDAKKIAKELGITERKPGKPAVSTDAGQGSRVRQRSGGTDASETADDEKEKKPPRRYRFQKSDDVSWGNLT